MGRLDRMRDAGPATTRHPRPLTIPAAVQVAAAAPATRAWCQSPPRWQNRSNSANVMTRVGASSFTRWRWGLPSSPKALTSFVTNMSRRSRTWVQKIIASRICRVWEAVSVPRLPGLGNEPLAIAAIVLSNRSESARLPRAPTPSGDSPSTQTSGMTDRTESSGPHFVPSTSRAVTVVMTTFAGIRPRAWSACSSGSVLVSSVIVSGFRFIPRPLRPARVIGECRRTEEECRGEPARSRDARATRPTSF